MRRNRCELWLLRTATIGATKARMKLQSSKRHLQILITLAAVSAALPAAAQERPSEPPRESQERAPEPQLESRDVKKADEPAPSVNLKIKGVRDGLQIRVLSKEEGSATQGPGTTSCNQDCELKLPAGSYTLIAIQPEPQEAQAKDLRVPDQVTTNEPDAARHKLGTVLGFGGILALAMGSYMTIGALAARDGTNGEFPSGLNGFFYAGLAGIGVGAGLTIGGFSLAAANRPATPAAVDRTPAVAERRGQPMGVSLSGTF